MRVFFQAEDGIRYLVRSRGLGDVYKRQMLARSLVDQSGVFSVTNHLQTVAEARDALEQS